MKKTLEKIIRLAFAVLLITTIFGTGKTVAAEDDPDLLGNADPYRVNLQASSGGTITAVSSDTNIQSQTDVTSVKLESGSDATLTVTANPDNGNSFSGWYQATFDNNGNINGYTGDPIYTQTTITLDKDSQNNDLYALFTYSPTIINEVSVTIDPSIAGVTVTLDWADPNDHSKGYNFYSQKPVPEISVNGNCSVSVASGDNVPANRKIVFWFQSKLEIFMGDFVDGNKYYVVAKLTADPGYEFASGKPTVTVNGKTITDVYVTNNEQGSFLEFYAQLEAYNPDDYRFVCTDGDDQSWEKGSSEVLSFTFDREKGGASKDDSHGILVDDTAVVKNDKNYKVKNGSVIIELQPEYLETLSAGEHKLTAIFTDDQTAEAKFTITGKEEEKKEEEKKDEKKDDSSNSTTHYVVPKTGIE